VREREFFVFIEPLFLNSVYYFSYVNLRSQRAWMNVRKSRMFSASSLVPTISCSSGQFFLRSYPRIFEKKQDALLRVPRQSLYSEAIAILQLS